MPAIDDPNPQYWNDYGPFQKVKHDLIRAYLNGWFPKLGTWAGRVLYVDTHAGRGRHRTGDAGSPIVALKTFLDHSYRDKLLQRSEFRFVFLERDPENLRELHAEIASLDRLPSRVRVDSSTGDAFAVLKGLVDKLRQDNQKMAPAFVFVDPYGFKLPASVLADVMSAGRVELFINVIWRELDMAVQQRPLMGSGLANTLDLFFGGGEWRTEITSPDVNERMRQAARLLARKIGARWWTFVKMVTGGHATRYILLHLSNHDKGRDLFKDCVWSIIPEGGFEVLGSDDPRQPMLIDREPDLQPLRTWALRKLAEQPQRWGALEDGVRSTLWRAAHLNQVIKQLRTEKTIGARAYSGRFSRKADPELYLIERA